MGLKAIVPNLEEVDAAFHSLYTKKGDQYEITGIEGMRTQADVDRLQQSLTFERNDHKKLKEAWKVLGDGVKPEDVAAQIARIPELEAAAAGKLDDAKIDVIVDTRVKAKLGPIERERDKLKTLNGELTTKVSDYETRDRTRAIGDAVKSAATKLKVADTALEDVIMFGERIFELSEDGRVVTKELNGITQGLEPEAWLADIQSTSRKPHWWGPTFGGGAGGNNNGKGGGANPWSHDGWNMTEQGKIYTQNPARAEQLAKAAGTEIGGLKPAKKT